MYCEYDTIRCSKIFCILCRTELQCQELQCQEESVTNLCRQCGNFNKQEQCEVQTKMCFDLDYCETRSERCETSNERCETSDERCETSSCNDFTIDDTWREISSSGNNKQNSAIDFTSREKFSQLIFYHPAYDLNIFLKSSNGQNFCGKISGRAFNFEIPCKNKLVYEEYLNNIQRKSLLCSNFQKNKQNNRRKYFYELQIEKKFKSLLFITHFLILVSANSLYSKMGKFLSNEDLYRNKMNSNKKKILRGRRADEPSMLKLLMLASVICVSHVDAFRGESLMFSDEI